MPNSALPLLVYAVVRYIFPRILCYIHKGAWSYIGNDSSVFFTDCCLRVVYNADFRRSQSRDVIDHVISGFCVQTNRRVCPHEQQRPCPYQKEVNLKLTQCLLPNKFLIIVLVLNVLQKWPRVCQGCSYVETWGAVLSSTTTFTRVI